MDTLLERLNGEQREAVTATEGYVRVVAGAGSGKTRTLATRFAYLIRALGILPAHILCVTFSNKAAQEMRQRIHALTGDNDTGMINTFHGFCVSVLQEDGHAIRYPKAFLVLDNSDIDAMLKIIYEERGLSLREMTFSAARDMIEIRKTITDTAYYREMLAMSLEGLRKRYEAAESPADIIFYGYLYQEKKCFGVDYNDLIVFSLYLFETVPEVRQKWQERLEYIMIDEFQDIDPLQYRLMKVLADYHKNLFVVGDPDQTIYTWRGASVRYLLDFDRVFTPTRTILMMRNYRSTPQILEAVNALIDKNRERIKKALLPVLPDGERPFLYLGRDPADEAAWMAGEVARLHAEGTPFREIAVLYRAHYVTRAIEEAFRRKAIPHVIYSGVRFYDRAEIKDALSYLRLIAYRDDLSFLRIANTPKRNLGERRIAFLKQVAEERGVSLYRALELSVDQELFKGTRARALLKLVETFSATAGSRPVSDLLGAVLDESGYERMLRTEGAQNRLDNLAELKQAIYEYETTCGEEVTLEAYLSRVALLTNKDTAEAGDRVKLMTIHAAKGLEFPTVFLCALNEGMMPSKKTDSQAAMEEERRLAFVAMTRAEKRLYLSASGGRDFDGAPRFPSRFILDVGRERLACSIPISDEMAKSLGDYVRQSDARFKDAPPTASPPRFAPGDRIRHPVFGTGSVLSVDTVKATCRIRFDALPTPRELALSARMEQLGRDGA